MTSKSCKRKGKLSSFLFPNYKRGHNSLIHTKEIMKSNAHFTDYMQPSFFREQVTESL